MHASAVTLPVLTELPTCTPAGNAMDMQFVQGLNAALDQLEAQQAQLSAVVLHGEGAHFCTGMVSHCHSVCHRGKSHCTDSRC